MADATYNNQNVYHKQEGDEEVVASGGKIRVEDGGVIELEDGGAFEFYNDESFTAENMVAIARSSKSTTIANSGTTTLSAFGDSVPTVLPSNYGTIFISAVSTMTNGSARLFSARAGQHLYIRFTFEALASLASLRIYCSGHASGIAGARVLLSTGSDAAQLSIQQSAASQGYVHLFGIADGIWAIVNGDNNLLTEVPA